jgi:SAM-dependent methyltransferase
VRVCGACRSTDCDAAWVCRDCGAQPTRIGGFLAFAPTLAGGSSGFHDALFRDLADVEARSFWFRARSALILWAMRRYCPEFRSFLEVGCGTAFVLAAIRSAFPQADLVGGESSVAGLEHAVERVPTATFLQLDATAIPFRDEFDVIGAFDVLEHIADDRAAIASTHDALKPGGSWLVTVPQHPQLWSQQDHHASHVRRYTATDLRRKVEGAGFEVVRMTSFVSLLLPLMAAARLRKRDGANDGEYDAIDELRQPRIVNRALEAVMSIERGMIRAGVSWPAGGSLLLVARKPDPHGVSR